MASQQLYQVYANNPLTPALTDVVPFQPNDAGVTEMGANTFQAIKNLLQPYNIYRTLLSQTSTSDPTGIELQNDLGGTVTLRRAGTGSYAVENTDTLFTSNKTFATPQWSTLRQGSNYATVIVSLANTGQITISTYLNGTLADGILSDFPLEILVYL